MMEPIPFRALLLVEGELSRDGRMIAPGALTWPQLPLTLYAQATDGHGGDPGPTIIAGRIDAITRTGNEIWGDGFFTTDEGIYTIAPMVADLTLKGISVDTAPSVIEYRAGDEAVESPVVEAEEAPVQQTPEEAANPGPEVSEGEPVHRESVNDVVMVMIEAEIIAATICGKAAMGNAYIELVTPSDPAAPANVTDTPAVEPDPVTASVWRVTSALVSASAPPAAEDTPAPSDAPPDAEKPAQPDYSGGAMIALYPPEASDLALGDGVPNDELHITLAYLGDAADLGPDAITELAAICDEIASSLEAGDGRIAGPAVFVNEPDPEDTDAQVPLVALIDSQWIAKVRMMICDALDASGIEQPSEHGFIPHMTLQYGTAPKLLSPPSIDLSFPSICLVVGEDTQEFQCGSALTASAIGAAPDEPPSAWFSDPRLDGPTALTVTDDGRVFGHIATWNTCHTGFGNRCVKPPRSRSNYAYFNLGELRTKEGDRVAVGQITLDTEHADLALTRHQTKLHYDHTGSAVADVHAGEDRFGIWVAGSVRPEASASDLRKFRGSKVSGDWRAVSGGLELISALAVNVPGFPVPRTMARVASATGEVTALISGDVEPTPWTDDQLVDALAFMAVHGEQTIDALAASAHEHTPTIDSVLATLEA